MKRTVILGLITLLSIGFCAQAQDTAQTKKEENHLIIKNRLFADFFYTYWFGLPEGVQQQGFNRGCNVSFIYDMPIRKNSPLSFGMGVGICSHNLYSNAYTFIDPQYNVTMAPLPEQTEYTVNKLSFTYVHIPLEFRYFNPKNNFKACLGIRVGLIADVHSKYVGHNTDILQYQVGNGRDVRIKSDKIPNRTKIPVELTFHTGWKYFDFNASYMLTKYFEEGNPQVYPFSLGFSIALY